jgi:AAA+ ATPase superfamily predicted ATPase
MPDSIMSPDIFLDRRSELARLDRLAGPALAVLWGRRRIGKTRLLVEWSRRRGGLYTVADQSAEVVQRRYFAEAVATKVPGFAEVAYPDWRALLRALAREPARSAIPGPLIIDEAPYLFESCPSLPSVLQSFIDHEARDAGLIVVLAGSSQHMMQDLVLGPAAPLYGRAQEAMPLRPLAAGWIGRGVGLPRAADAVRAFSVWGGVPWYWALAARHSTDLEGAVDELVLDPLGPLHSEPDRLLLEELPRATSLRPLLDAIGAGAHRLSEIAGRVGQPATSLGRPLGRLIDLGYVRRELPFGEHERSSKRALYRIDDAFFRFWFRVVAPHRGLLTVATPAARRALWRRHAAHVHAEAWEDLARRAVPLLEHGRFDHGEPFSPAARSWRGAGPEWDVVASSPDGKTLLVGEAKWHQGPVDAAFLDRTFKSLADKGRPPFASQNVVHALFVPECPAALKRRKAPYRVVDAGDVLAVLR